MKYFFLCLLGLAPIFSFSQQNTITDTMTVFGSCSMCKERIETNAAGKGITNPKWSADSKLLVFTIDTTKTNRAALRSRLLKSGHDADGLSAPDNVYKNLPACCLYRSGNVQHDEPHVETKQSSEPHTMQFTVSGVCSMCKSRIEKAAMIKGVHTAAWNGRTKELIVIADSNQVSSSSIREALLAKGHDVDGLRTSDELYKALPACCTYRDPKISEHNLTDSHTSIPDSVIMRGVIVYEDNKGNFTPIIAASVQNKIKGITVLTNEYGMFQLPWTASDGPLTISYNNRSVEVTPQPGADLNIRLEEQVKELKAVTISSTRFSSYVSSMNPLRTQVMTEKELFKAACCNLSESFETNPSVDVSFTDAVSGARQIQLLGLSGIYTALQVENLPGPKGLATPLGLNFIAGPWIESIQLTKGIGSVLNGFESIAGQINVELKKPETAEKVYLNGYINSAGKADVNLSLMKKINNRWATGLLLHDDFLNNREMDFNKDGFRDQPIGNQFNFVNRWHYADLKNWEIQFGAKYLNDLKEGGSTQFNRKMMHGNSVYGVGFESDRLEGFAKIGYLFTGKKYKSFGLQLAAFRHNQHSYFGTTIYDGTQKNLYANLIYQSLISNTKHTFKTGLSMVMDTYHEKYGVQHFDRDEKIPGAFFEYTYNPSTKFTMVAGLRADKHNLFGTFITPRAFLRYQPIIGTTIRVSAGRGQRTANIFAENFGYLVSNRTVHIEANNGTSGYGLLPEVAWNKGITVDQQIKINGRNTTLSLEYYRNDFTNQVIADVETYGQLHFYNLSGKSYSNSFQAEWNANVFKGFDVRLAWRYFDVKTQFKSGLLQRPFVSRNRSFLNLAYTNKGWSFDYTINYMGSKRIPSTSVLPIESRMPATSPAYWLMNGQATKTFGSNDRWAFYVGVENVTNYYQKQTILFPQDPFDPRFDASMIWGPVTGRMIYTGFRFKIK